MAKKQVSKTVDATVTAAAAPAAAANPLAGMAAQLTAPAAAPAAAAKVHSLNAGGVIVKAANHVAAFKGTKAVPAGGSSYQLTGLPYNPAAGHVNRLQWTAVVQAMEENGGTATIAQIAEVFTAKGLAAGLAAGFVTYRAKGAKPNLQVVTA